MPSTRIDDLAAKVTAHPLPAIGIALAAGALMGLRPTRTAAAPDAPAGIGAVITGALAAIALRLLKDAALAQLAGAAQRWYGERRDLHGSTTVGTRPGPRPSFTRP